MENNHDLPKSPDWEEVRLAVLEASPNASVAVDDQARIQCINRRVEETFGYGQDELIGSPIELLVPEEHGELHIRHRNAYLLAPVSQPMGIGLDLLGRRKDGTVFPVEISLSPVDMPAGRLVRATIVDISARKAAEAALDESERLFRTVLDASPNAIIATDQASLLTYLDPQVVATFGYALAAGLNYYGLRTGCRLIAEGIETQAEADTLVELGIEFGQGYLFGRPEQLP